MFCHRWQKYRCFDFRCIYCLHASRKREPTKVIDAISRCQHYQARLSRRILRRAIISFSIAKVAWHHVFKTCFCLQWKVIWCSGLPRIINLSRHLVANNLSKFHYRVIAHDAFEISHFKYAHHRMPCDDFGEIDMHLIFISLKRLIRLKSSNK